MGVVRETFSPFGEGKAPGGHGVSLSRSLRPQSSSLHEASARTLIVLDVDEWKDKDQFNLNNTNRRLVQKAAEGN